MLLEYWMGTAIFVNISNIDLFDNNYICHPNATYCSGEIETYINTLLKNYSKQHCTFY